MARLTPPTAITKTTARAIAAATTRSYREALAGDEQREGAGPTEAGDEQRDRAGPTEAGDEQRDSAGPTEAGDEQRDGAGPTEAFKSPA